MLSKKDVIRVARAEERFEGCKALSEFSWELHEAFLCIGNTSESGFLHLSSPTCKMGGNSLSPRETLRTKVLESCGEARL